MIERVLYLIYYKRVAWAWAYCTVAGLDRAVARNQVLSLPSCSWQLSVEHLLGLLCYHLSCFVVLELIRTLSCQNQTLLICKEGECSFKVHLAEVEPPLKEFPGLVVAGFDPGSALSVCPPATKMWNQYDGENDKNMIYR